MDVLINGVQVSMYDDTVPQKMFPLRADLEGYVRFTDTPQEAVDRLLAVGLTKVPVLKSELDKLGIEYEEIEKAQTA